MSETTAPASTTTAPATTAPATLFAGGEKPAAAPAAASGAPPASTTQPASESSDPFSKWTPERRGFYENKGWLKDGKLDVESLAEGYAQLEKMRGVPPEETFRISKNATPEELSRLHERLGVPKDAAGYEIKAEGADPAAVKRLGEAAHKMNLTPSQLGEFLKYNAAELKMAEDRAEQEQTTRLEADRANLQREWGQAMQQNQAISERAATTLFPKEWSEPDENGETVWSRLQHDPKVGPAGLAKALHALGTKLGEDRFVTGQPTGGGMRTPESAAARKDELLSNPEYRKAYLSGDKGKVAEIAELEKAILAGR